MPCYPNKFAENINIKKDKLYTLFMREPRNEDESFLKKEVARFWHPLPELLPSCDSPLYAIDGSNACLAVQGGRYISIVQALLQGKDWREVEVDVEAFRDTQKVDVERFHQVHRQWLEWKIGGDYKERISNSFLFLDGSLYIPLVLLSWARFAQRMPEGLEDMPLRALEAFLSLLEATMQYNIKLIGISKTSRGHFYPRLLLNKETDITDLEVFSFWTEGVGFSTPLLVGPYVIPQPWDWERVKRDFLDSISSPKSEEVSSRLEKVLPFLSVVIFYIRFEEGDEVYRVDVLSSSLGIKADEEELKEITIRDEELIYPILSVLLSSHGGFNVYQTLLYAAHNEIILRDRDQDVYLTLLRELTRLPIRRSKVDTRFGRRF
ncbi:MAG: DNA double-strand break repair nuclease NurA [bacterium]